MDTTLLPIDLELTQLEESLLEEYARLREDSAIGLVYILLPRKRTEHYLARLRPLYERLQGTTDTHNLQLVTELHDELRVRVMVLRNLLEREVPLIYLERALTEIIDPESTLSIRTHPAERYTPRRPEPKDGILRRLLSSVPLLGSFFQQKATASGIRTKKNTASNANSAAPSKDFPAKNVRRTMGLHYLMEEDRLHLIKPGEALPRITHSPGLPPSLARFVTRDLSEAHFATRASSNIARTPEQLKRKLAEREQNQ
ncbi:hypothetical protein [Thiohalomonas denitrificans]|nr:hypothetical protein [Thiohalomonas denitrificans]